MTKLVVSETGTSLWHFHLRRLNDEEEPQLSGGTNLVALCGTKLGWDTQIPTPSYGKVIGRFEHWCARCKELADVED